MRNEGLLMPEMSSVYGPVALIWHVSSVPSVMATYHSPIRSKLSLTRYSHVAPSSSIVVRPGESEHSIPEQVEPCQEK